MISTYKGFLLRTIKYGDHNAIINIYTDNVGSKSFYIRGLYSAKSKKKSFLEPLNEVAIQVEEAANNQSLPLVKSFQLCQTPIEKNIKNNTVIFFIAELLYTVLKKEQQNQDIYKEVHVLLEELKNKNNSAHIYFCFHLMKHLGFSPLPSNNKFLEIESGTFKDFTTLHTFDEEISGIWRDILNAKSTGLFNKNKLLDSLMVYYTYHMPEFKIPDSLEIVREILE